MDYLIWPILGLIVVIALMNWLYRMPLLNAAGKRVFITGTDTGLGRHLALRLDSMGVKVYAGCNTTEGASSLRKEAGKEMVIVPLDVTDRDSVKKAKDAILADLPEGKGLWGLVNNAGILKSAVFGLASVEDYEKVMGVNFFGTVRVNEAFALLIRDTRGRIANVISVMGRVSSMNEPYSCSKFALQPYTDGLRRWMKGYGVYVASIEPGFMQTGITSNQTARKGVEEIRDKLAPFIREENKDWLHQMVEGVFKFWVAPPLSSLSSIDYASNAIVHALFAKNPKTRYLTGFDSHLLYRFTHMLPDWILDYFVTRYVAIHMPMFKVKRNSGYPNGFLY